jgi:hypothetical protein
MVGKVRIRPRYVSTIILFLMGVSPALGGPTELYRDIDDWLDTIRHTAHASRDSSIHISGASSIRMEMVDRQTAEWRTDRLSCDTTSTYTLIAQTRTLLLRTAGLRLFVMWLSATGDTVETIESDWIGASSNWIRQQLVVKAPTSATSAVIGCRLSVATRWGGQPDNEQRIAWVDGISWGPVPDIRIERADPGNIFESGERAVFDVHTAEIGISERISAEVSDVWGRHVMRNEWVPSTGETSHTFDFAVLPPGYYRVKWSVQPQPGMLPRIEKSSFVVLGNCVPTDRRDAIAVDGAFSWAYKDTTRAKIATAMLGQLGIACVRDRYSWSHVSPFADEFDTGQYDTPVRLQSQIGVEVFTIFQRTPRWASDVPDSIHKRFVVRYPPSDPMSAYKAARRAASNFRDDVSYWEIWNEANLPGYFIGRPDEYAAILKAAYLGVKAGNPDAAVLTCSFTGASEEWARRVIENGALQYADIYNFHYYGRPWRMSASVEKHQQRMIDADSRLPMWMSENGERTAPNVHGSSVAGELKVAQYMVESAVYALSNGVDRYFWFAFPPIWERAAGPWGLVHADLTPTVSYATLATLRAVLGVGSFMGEVEVEPGKASAYLFDTGRGDATLVVLPDSETYLRIPSASADVAVADIVGNESSVPWSVDIDGTLHLWTTKNAIFVTGLDANTIPVNQPVTNWTRLDIAELADPSAQAVWAYVDARGIERDVDPRRLRDQLMSVDIPDTASAWPFRLVLVNLSDNTVDISVVTTVQSGIEFESTLPDEITIKPGSQRDIAISVLTGGMEIDREYRLEWRGRYDGGVVEPVVVYLRRVVTR